MPRKARLLTLSPPLDLVHAGGNIVMPETATVNAILKLKGEDYTLTLEKL